MKVKNLKIGTLLLAVAAMGLLSCGGSDEAAGGDGGVDPESTYAKIDVPEGITPRVKFAHTFGDIIESEVEIMINDFKAKVSAKEGVEIEVELDHYGNYNDTVSIIGNQLRISNGPTMAIAYPDAVASLMKEFPNQIVNMQSYLSDEVYGLGSDGYLGDTTKGEKDFIKSYLDEGRVFDKTGTYVLPYMKSSEIMLYNLDMLKTVLPAYDSTIKEGQIEAYLKNISFDKLMDIAKYAKTNAGKLGLNSLEYPVYYDSDANMLISQIEQKGLKFATKDASGNVVLNLDATKDPTNSAAVAELLNQYRTWRNEGLLCTKGAEGTYASEAFKNGKAIFCIGSSGGAGYSFPETGTFDFGVCKVPYASATAVGAKYVSQGPSIVFLTDAGSSAEQNMYDMIYSWKFYKYITNTRNNVIMCTNHSMGYVPVKQSCYKNSDWLDFIADEDNMFGKAAKVLRQEIGDNFITSLVFNGSATYRTEAGALVANTITTSDSIESLIATAVNNTIKAM